MQLTSVQIRMFRNILDTGEVRVDPGVTCLVGKNESGKTAFLEALRRINPAQGKSGFDVLTHYPAWREKIDRRKGLIDKTKVVTVEFDLDPADEKALARIFGPRSFNSKTFKLERHYDGSSTYYIPFDEEAAASFLWESLGLKEISASEASVSSLLALQAEIEAARDIEGASAIATAAAARLTEILKGRETLILAAISTISLRLPKFFYFSSYSTLPGVVKIKELLAADMDELDVNNRTARSLLLQAGAEDEYLLDPDYQKRVRELENVANAITQDILRYWTTNDNLRVKFDITQKTVQRGSGQASVMDELHIRMDDSKHFLSLPFNERSTGFQWFSPFWRPLVNLNTIMKM